MDECVRVLDHMPERNPTDGTFELTIRCNLHCKMCLFRHDDSENAELMKNELTAEQWIDLARQAAEAGTLSLLITGGEPLLRPDFCEIWEGIYKQGFILTLYTNATLVTPKVMETLRKYPPHKISVTVYGASPETYEKVTGSAAEFDRAIEGIQQLISLPSHVSFRTTVIKDNKDDVGKIYDLIRGRFDPEADYSIAQNVYKAVRGGCADVESCRIKPEDGFLVSVGLAAHRIRADVGERFEQGHVDFCWDENATPSELHTSKPHYSLWGCHAGMKSYTVSWDGKLLGCQLFDYFSQEIRGDFHAAWERFPEGVHLPPIHEECAQCDFAGRCTICPAVLYVETGCFTEKPEYICQYTHAREMIIMRIKEGEIHYEDL